MTAAYYHRKKTPDAGRILRLCPGLAVNRMKQLIHLMSLKTQGIRIPQLSLVFAPVQTGWSNSTAAFAASTAPAASFTFLS